MDNLNTDSREPFPEFTEKLLASVAVTHPLLAIVEAMLDDVEICQCRREVHGFHISRDVVEQARKSLKDFKEGAL